MLRAARLDGSVYREIAEDQSSSSQAILVVTLVGLALGAPTVVATITTVISTIASWVILTGIIFMVSARLFQTGPQGHSTFGPLVRAIGFAHTPSIFIVFSGFVGPQLWLFYPILFWHIAAVSVAVRETLDYQSTGRAVGIALLSSILLGVLNYVLGTVIGGLSA